MTIPSTARQARYERRPGHIYAIEPRAFLDIFTVPSARTNVERETLGVTIVDVCGPLDQHAGGWCDSYADIVDRVKLAAASPSRGIVLKLDSPGGECAGCFEASRELRRICAEARKPLIAYVDGKACSAAYALACAAQRIIISDTALVGSIGVVSERVDHSAMLAQRGVRVELVATGSAKGDGHPDTPLTDAERARTQSMVDSLGAMFFQLVAGARPISIEQVQALDAAIHHGASALRAGLADEIDDFESTLTRISRGEANMTQTVQAKSKAGEAGSYGDAVAALEELAKGDDANAAAARKALQVLQAAHGDGDGDGAPPAEGEGGDGEKKPDAEGDEKKPDAEGDEKKPDAEGDEKKPDAGAGLSTAAQALAEVHKLKAQMKLKDERAERKALLDQRPDFDAKLRAELMRDDTPLAAVKRLCVGKDALPRSNVKPAAAAGARGTVGEGQRDQPLDTPPPAPVDPAEQARLDLDRRMGLTDTTLKAQRRGHSMIFGAVASAPSKTEGAQGAK